tara:strand:+ start:12458 stop:12652 length:195 start_codon:yes stop_codon:yes gene_type:complete
MADEETFTDEIGDALNTGKEVAIATTSGLIQSLAIVAVPLLMIGLGAVIAVALVKLPSAIAKGV